MMIAKAFGVLLLLGSVCSLKVERRTGETAAVEADTEAGDSVWTCEMLKDRYAEHVAAMDPASNYPTSYLQMSLKARGICNMGPGFAGYKGVGWVRQHYEDWLKDRGYREGAHDWQGSVIGPVAQPEADKSARAANRFVEAKAWKKLSHFNEFAPWMNDAASAATGARGWKCPDPCDPDAAASHNPGSVTAGPTLSIIGTGKTGGLHCGLNNRCTPKEEHYRWLDFKQGCCVGLSTCMRQGFSTLFTETIAGYGKYRVNPGKHECSGGRAFMQENRNTVCSNREDLSFLGSAMPVPHDLAANEGHIQKCDKVCCHTAGEKVDAGESMAKMTEAFKEYY
jgi:hypothetical protein